MIFVLLFVMNVVFVLLLGAAYGLVTRRQIRIYGLVEHLAALARKNLPLHTGLRMIAQDAGGFFGARLERAARLVEEGRPLGEALDACRFTLPPLVRNMARLGDASGNLAGFLGELARSYRRIMDFHYRSVYYFMYPVLLSFAVFAATQGIIVGMAPRFRAIAMQLRQPVNDAGWTFVAAGSQLLLVASLVIAALVYFGSSSVYFGRSPLRFLKPVADRLALCIPLVRRLVVDSSHRQFALAVGLMLRQGATLPEAARAAMDLELNAVLRRRLEPLARGVEEGGRLGDIGRQARLPAEFAWFLESGETSGALAESLLQAAAYYEARVAYTGHLATRSVVPLFVVANGLVVLATWLLVFGPVMSVLRHYAGGGRF